ncbi:glycosyltransferase family 2 protein [Dyadobacter aurulentus]|uniref:glycosyltransferase family 2 protein n=1 Tax=Dyadobacter sp. UC 10 TaxID=2605428 RepID=UPI0011F0A4F8|nr:glycosyltransferase [Dyadobacter sp. UC 10]KAA0993491.1 glycosyltransferase [Dyadobacter sp. UC 10]
MNCPKISVIIPTYNNGTELRRAVKSILLQDALIARQCTVEILIVNDASHEKFQDQLTHLELEFEQCRILNNSVRSGPAAARNAGIRAADGELIGFLDADDEWPSDKVSVLLPYFNKNNIDVAAGKIQYMVAEEQPKINMKFEDAQNRITHVHLGTLLARKSLFENELLFDETLTFSEDVDWWFRLREKNIGIIISEATTLYYHVHGNNMSVNKSIEELQLLKIFHRSVKRRKENQSSPFMPQIKDFRVDQPDPLISIILPLYNGKNLVGKSIDSVLAQTFTNWELLVVDDGSTDEGAQHIENNYPNVRIIRQQNAGVAAARNMGVEHANGDIIAFLDQDDEWVSTKLRDQWDLLKRDPYCSFVTCNQRFICNEGVKLPANFSEKLFEEHRSLVPSALLIRKQALLSVNMFDQSLEVSSDFDLIRKLRLANCKEANVEKMLLKKWYHGENASLNKPLMKREILSLLHRQIKGQ